jgi:creatinine amidohydrolase/Fe(II)-dependent formamide hydrolase-like protein
VLGDPTGATAAEGQRSLELMVEDVLRRISHGVVNDHGMLLGDHERTTERTPA